MPGVDAPYLGFDPGGSHCFGVALFDGHGVLLGTTSSVDEALAWAVDKCGTRTPTAAGIDTLLHWCTGPSGYRPCDRLLKQRYAAKSGSIMAPNSLYGAMAIGGMALALRLKQHWPDIVLNETHPKVLLHALGVPKYDPSDLKSVVRWLIGTMKSTDWSASEELSVFLCAGR